jgi:hypothetical protein
VGGGQCGGACTGCTARSAAREMRQAPGRRFARADSTLAHARRRHGQRPGGRRMRSRGLRRVYFRRDRDCPVPNLRTVEARAVASGIIGSLQRARPLALLSNRARYETLEIGGVFESKYSELDPFLVKASKASSAELCPVAAG